MTRHGSAIIPACAGLRMKRHFKSVGGVFAGLHIQYGQLPRATCSITVGYLQFDGTRDNGTNFFSWLERAKCHRRLRLSGLGRKRNRSIDRCKMFMSVIG